MNARLEELFHQVADLSPEARARYFEELQIDEETRRQLDDLLAFDSGSSQFLLDGVGLAASRSLPQLDPKGWRCGPYRLLEVIGRGGMGAVYLAERIDGEVAQRVAVKLLPVGAGDAQRERFLRERQILASLAHPNIARMLDAGHAAGGQPFLAMEYVAGQPIDAFAAGLSVQQKIRLFLKVCAAVGCLHRNLIVHRDLKPGNILVTAEGEPKLLDFGISKMLDVATDSTITSMRILTPDYASPEQVTGGAVTTATDIYSLGAVLYRLLTEKPAHEFHDHSADSVARVITTREVTRPAKWAPELKGDLEAILLKALRKDPQGRYATVEQFAGDLEAYLESRPVKARSGTAWYRTRKFLRRYWVTVAAASLVIVSLAIGLYVANHERDLANRERAAAQKRFLEVRQLAHIFVFDLHDEVARLDGSTKAREMMVRTGLQYLDSLARNAEGDLELQKEIAASYMKIGDAQGALTTPNLGRFDEALASYQKAGDIFRRIAAKNSSYLPDLAAYYSRYAAFVRFAHNPKLAREISASAIQTFDRLRSSKRFNSQMENSYIGAWCTLGDIDEDQGEYRQAWTEFSHCGDLARAQLNATGSPQARRNLSQALERIGTAAQELGLLQEALRALNEEESELGKLLASEPLNPRFRRAETVLHQFRSRVYYDDSYPDLGDPSRALISARRYLERAEDSVRHDSSNMSARVSQGVAMYRVSVSLREFDASAAVRLARQSVQKFDELLASGYNDYLTVSNRATALRRLGEAQLKARRVADAVSSAESGLAARRRLTETSASGSQDRVELVQMLILAGQANAAAGNLARAEDQLREAHAEALQIAKREGLPNLIPLAHAHQALGAFLARRRRIEEARRYYQELVELWRRFPQANDYVYRQKAASERLLASLH